jgi:hypothetical protein
MHEVTVSSKSSIKLRRPTAGGLIKYYVSFNIQHAVKFNRISIIYCILLTLVSVILVFLIVKAGFIDLNDSRCHLIPIVCVYENAEKFLIEQKNQCGIYMFTDEVDGPSSIFTTDFKKIIAYLTRHKNSFAFSSALLKYYKLLVDLGQLSSRIYWSIKTNIT